MIPGRSRATAVPSAVCSKESSNLSATALCLLYDELGTPLTGQVSSTGSVINAKDAVHLARLLRLDEVTAVAIPTIEQEAARDLVRAREDCRSDLMRARHRLSKLLMRHGIAYDGGDAWTGKHDAWLRNDALPRLTSTATRLTFDAGYETVLAAKARRDRLDVAIEQMAAACEFTALVRRLGCLRGIGTLTRVRARGRDRRLAPVHR